MDALMEFIVVNYAWILIGSIIILLAIIGYYADKTNFGQGKQEQNEDSIVDNENVIQQQPQEIKETPIVVQNNIVNPNQQELNSNDVVVENIPKENETEKIENEFEMFDKEFNEIVPKKEFIDDELLDEIDSLSLDKTQKLKLTDIPDLDDVELPEIKKLNYKEEDIWKF